MKGKNIVNNIDAAFKQIKPFIHETPLLYSSSFSKMFSSNIYLKAENLQKTGSFKVRGALNKMLNLKTKYVCAASMGNHAQGVAYAAMCLGMKAKIVMPDNASLAKIEATKNYNAQVILWGNEFSHALNYAKSIKDYSFIHPFDDIDVITGQGTIGVEIVTCCPSITDVLIPVGGGGLIAGVASYIKERLPKVKVIGIQSKNADSGVKSFRAGKITPSIVRNTIADGIAVNEIGQYPFEFISRYVDDMVTVSDDAIAKALLLFMERKKLVVEGAGAVGLAFLLENGTKGLGKNILFLISGGNIDFMLIDKIIYKGLLNAGRIMQISLLIKDANKDIRHIMNIVNSKNGIIKHLSEESFQDKLTFSYNKLNLTIETSGKEHSELIMKALKTNGFEVIMIN